MKKIEKLIKRVLKEIDEPQDPNKTGVYGVHYNPDEANKLAADLAKRGHEKVMTKARGEIDEAAAAYGKLLQQEIYSFGEVFGVLQGKPHVIPESWKSILQKNSLGRWVSSSMLGKNFVVGFCNTQIAGDKMAFVPASGSAMGVNTDFFNTASIGSVPEKTSAPTNPQTGQESAAFADLEQKSYDLSQYNEENLQDGVELLNYALRKAKEVTKQVAISRLPENVNPTLVISIAAPMFSPLIAYAYKHKLSPSRGVTPQQYVEFMMLADPTGGKSVALGDKNRTGSLPLITGNAIASYIAGNPEQLKQVSALRMFRPMIRFYNGADHEDQKEDLQKITILLPGSSGNSFGLYINFPFRTSIFYTIIHEQAQLGARASKRQISVEYESRDTPKEYLRKVILYVMLGMKTKGLAQGVSGTIGRAETVQQIAAKKAAEQGKELPAQPSEPSVEKQETSEVEQQAVAHILQLLLRRSSYRPVRRIGFQNFVGSLLEVGTQAFMAESKKSKKTIQAILESKQTKKNRTK